jgi:ABC-type glycerol-3-phosphate transport system substrate-binding protein
MRAALVLAVAVLAGCGGGSDPSAPATTQPAATSHAPAKPKQPHPFLAWATTNYPGASWLPAIVAVKEQIHQTWVATSMPADAEAKTVASEICSAVSAWQISVRGGFGGVRVAAASGERLVLRETVADPC